MNEFERTLLDTVKYTGFIAAFADPAKTVVGIEPYTYTVDGNVLPAPITATAPQSFNVIMDSDSDFVSVYFSGYGRTAASTMLLVNPAMLVQITDKSSGRAYFNRPSPMPMICGQSGFPFLLTSPRIIRPRSTLQLTARSAQVQSFNGFFFCLHGAKIYYG